MNLVDGGLRRPRAESQKREDYVVRHGAIDVTVRIVLQPYYVADEVVERLRGNVIPACFAFAQNARPIYQSELLSKICSTAGVRSARIVRFCRSGRETSDGYLSDRIDAEAGESLRLNRFHIEVE